MKILCNENVARSIYVLLGQEGYDVERVQDTLELGYDDEEIVDYARETSRVILTNDDDFFDFDAPAGILFLDELRAKPREVVTAIQRIERRVGTEGIDDYVFHVPNGWI